MGNLKNFNFNKFDAFLTSSEYYDFTLSNEEIYLHSSITDNYGNGMSLSGACLLVYYDFNNKDIYKNVSGNTISSGDTITSLTHWSESITNVTDLHTFGYTGLDNGYIDYEKNNSSGLTSGLTIDSNVELVNTITGSTVSLDTSEKALIMNKVTGYTGNIVYPIETIVDVNVGDYSKLCGGFYQGYYKLDGYDYQVLPNRYAKGFTSEFWVRKSSSSCTGVTGTTLNDLYPDNKGMFFYMGTRAENKYWNFFEGNNTGCTSDCTLDSGCTETLTNFCTIPKETDIYITGTTKYPISLSPRYFKEDLIENQFLIYGRADGLNEEAQIPDLSSGPVGVYLPSEIPEVTGHTEDDCGTCNSCGEPTGLGSETVCSYDGKGLSYTSSTRPITYDNNPFLIYGRADKFSGTTGHTEDGCGTCNSCGKVSGLGNETVCSYTGTTTNDQNKDHKLDVIDNAIGFRIKDDGAIGYRLLTMSGSCDDKQTYFSGVSMEEGYSVSGTVKDDEWTHIMVRYVMADEYDECELKIGPRRFGRLMFYVNGKLKYFVNDFDELILKRLDEYSEKQLGVPYNFSLGGGSQGLIESLTFDGQDKDDLGLSIEKFFGGTFIGDVSQFKFYGCDLNWCEIKDQYNSNKNRYKNNNI